MIQSNIILISIIFLLLIIALLIIIICIYSRKERFKTTNKDFPPIFCPDGQKRVNIGNVAQCAKYSCPVSCNCESKGLSCSLASPCPSSQTQIKDDCIPSLQICNTGTDCASGICTGNKCVCHTPTNIFVDRSDNCGTPIDFDNQTISLEMVGYIDNNSQLTRFVDNTYCLKDDQINTSGDPVVDFRGCALQTPKRTRIYPQIWKGGGDTDADQCVKGTCPGSSNGIYASYLMKSTATDPTLFIVNSSKGEGKKIGYHCLKTEGNDFYWVDDSSKDARHRGGSDWCGWRIYNPGPLVNGWDPYYPDGTTTYITDNLEFSITSSSSWSGNNFICSPGGSNPDLVNYVQPDDSNFMAIFRFKLFS